MDHCNCRNGIFVYNFKVTSLFIFKGMQVNLTEVLLGYLFIFGKTFKVLFLKFPLTSMKLLTHYSALLVDDDTYTQL